MNKHKIMDTRGQRYREHAACKNFDKRERKKGGTKKQKKTRDVVYISVCRTKNRPLIHPPARPPACLSYLNPPARPPRLVCLFCFVSSRGRGEYIYIYKHDHKPPFNPSTPPSPPIPHHNADAEREPVSMSSPQKPPPYD